MQIENSPKNSEPAVPVHRARGFPEGREKTGAALFMVDYSRQSLATSSASIDLVNRMLKGWLETFSTDAPPIIRLTVSAGQSRFGQLSVGRKHDDERERRLASRLWAAFEADPLEDGMDHPAEKIIEKALQSEGGGILDCLKKLCLDVRNRASRRRSCVAWDVRTSREQVRGGRSLCGTDSQQKTWRSGMPPCKRLNLGAVGKFWMF